MRWLSPIATGDDQRGYPLATWFGAIGTMFGDVEDLVRSRPGRQPWQQAFDINQAPTWLYPWLGQVVGVRDLNGLTASQQQAKIIAEAGFYRASVSALKAAVATTLTGTQAVRVVERSSDPRTIEVITNTSETPNPTLTAQVAQANKRAMLVMTVVASDIPLVDEGTRTIDAAAVAATVDGAVLADVT